MLSKFFPDPPQHKDIIQVTPEAWLIPNFLSKEEIDEILFEFNISKRKPTDVIHLSSILKHYDKCASVFPKLIIPKETITRTTFYNGAGGQNIHSDIMNTDNYLLENVVEDRDETKDQDEFGLGIFAAVIYLKVNCDGGEICYPEYGYEYKPSAGDMAIHRSETLHGVKRVTSGIRISAQFMPGGRLSLNSELLLKNKENLNPTPERICCPNVRNLRLKKFKETYINDGSFEGDKCTFCSK
jgi:hypothetical protein